MAMKFPQQFGPYTLQTLIARGGMAEVYRATLPGVGGFEKTVAIKKILPHLAENEEFIAMLVDEANIIVSLNHSNIAQVYDLGRIEDTYYIAIEYVHGVDLAGILKEFKKRDEYMPISHALHITSCMCAGLHVAHSALDSHGRSLDIVHRDISPHNVLISFAGDVKVIDFGVAKARTKETHTQAGVIKGKLLYMAPEQAMSKVLDGRADLFAAGLVFYNMLTNKLPFEGDNEFQIYNNILHSVIVPPRQLNPNVSEEVNQVAMMLLQRDPDQRYQDGYSAKRDLDRALHNLSPGYSTGRLSAFVEDNFSFLLQKKAKPPSLKFPNTPSQPAPANTPSQPPVHAWGAPIEDDAVPPTVQLLRPAAELFANHAETVEGNSLGLTQTPQTRFPVTPANGSSTHPPVHQQIVGGFGPSVTGEFPASVSAETAMNPGMRAEMSPEEKTSEFTARGKGGKFPLVPVLGILLVILLIAAMLVYKTQFRPSAEETLKVEPELEVEPSVEPDLELKVPDDPEEPAIAAPLEESDAGVDVDLAPERVEIRIDTVPADAELRIGGELSDSKTFDLPLSEEPLILEVRAEGFESQEFALVPSESQEKTVILKSKQAVIPKPPKVKPKPKPKDLPKPIEIESTDSEIMDPFAD